MERAVPSLMIPRSVYFYEPVVITAVVLEVLVHHVLLYLLGRDITPRRIHPYALRSNHTDCSDHVVHDAVLFTVEVSAFTKNVFYDAAV